MVEKSTKADMKTAGNSKKAGMNKVNGLITIALTILGAVLFFLSYTTGYYIFGQMNSPLITGLICAAIVAACASIAAMRKYPDKLWAKLITFFVTGFLAAAAILILGDRVEGIGNCIVTDYDSGHGGEEAIYMSLVGAGCLLAAMIFNIIGAFVHNGNAPISRAKRNGLVAGAGIVAAAAIFGMISLTGISMPGKAAGGGAVGSTTGGEYKVTFSQENGNTEGMPDYQFLSADLGMLVKMDSRFNIDVLLTLDGKGKYTIVSDAYVIDSGKRVEIGDASGLGLVCRTTSEGTYTDNGNGSVTTSPAEHVKFELHTDSYSAQMKDLMNIDLNGSNEDGDYDSADFPVLLDYVPETTWTLSDGSIETWAKGAGGAGGEYKITFSQENGNVEGMPGYQFLSADLGMLTRMDSRFYIDVLLTLDGAGGYTIVSEAYVVDSGKRVEIGDPSGLGIVCRTTSEGTYTDDGNGSVTTGAAQHVKFELHTDTYSAQMKDLMNIDLNGSNEDGDYDSADFPVLLDYIPETIWTLSGSDIVTYEKAEDAAAGATGATTETAAEEEPAAETPATDAPEAGAAQAPAADASAAGLEVASDDGATKMVFGADGTYKFIFEQYGIEDAGTYKFEGGVLTLTDANGKKTVAEGDPLKLHYAFSQSDQLTGDFTIPAGNMP